MVFQGRSCGVYGTAGENSKQWVVDLCRGWGWGGSGGRPREGWLLLRRETHLTLYPEGWREAGLGCSTQVCGLYGLRGECVGLEPPKIRQSCQLSRGK